eukprot:gene10653-14283_t
MVDRDDDLRIGMKTSAITLGAHDVPAVTAFYLVFLAIWTAALWSVVNPWVWGAMLVVALAQVVWHFQLIKNRSRDGCFKAFRLNHWLGFTVFVGVVLGLEPAMRVTATEAKNRFGSLCAQAKREPVFVEKAGHIDTVILSAEQYLALQASSGKSTRAARKKAFES